LEVRNGAGLFLSGAPWWRLAVQGKLIALEASDGSGKGTQAEKLYSRLVAEGHLVRKIEFPNYKSPSSALIKMYLQGAFGTEPGAVNPYIASTFYTVDRFAAYKTEWEEFYLKGGIIIADRYTTANMVHQGVKIPDPVAKENYLDWLLDFEYRLFQLPSPDCVLFLDMPPEYSRKLLADRAKKTEGADIHEENEDFMRNSYHNAVEMATRYRWHRISCVTGRQLRDIQDIHEEIYQIVLQYVL
jgi:dTMP kinase